MRKILLVFMATLVGLSGCSLSRGEDFDTKEKPGITVFLNQDSTQAQRDAVEAAIRAQPGLDTITYESPQEAYARYKSLMQDDPAFDPSIGPDTMPPSFRFTTTDLKAYNKIRNSSFADDVKKMLGVYDVVIQCATIAECKETLTPPPTPRVHR